MKIYLDVDDTLADFLEHAVARGVPRWEGSWYTTDPATWTQEQKDIQARTNEEMSKLDFWLTMPPAPGAFELIAASRQRTDDVYLLTALPSFAKTNELRTMIYGAKMQYAVDVLHMPPQRTIICARADKVLHATNLAWNTPNVLVDDAHQNVREWLDAKGIAIHHETGNMAATIAAVKRI